MRTAIALALLLVASASYGQKQADTTADQQAIANTIAVWQEISKTGEVDKVLAYFADDVMIFPPGQPVIKGLAAVRRMLANRKGPRSITTWNKPSSITVANGGDLAYVVTGNHVTTTDAVGRSVTRHNRGITIWRKEPDNSWKEIVVILNAEPSTQPDVGLARNP